MDFPAIFVPIAPNLTHITNPEKSTAHPRFPPFSSAQRSSPTSYSTPRPLPFPAACTISKRARPFRPDCPPARPHIPPFHQEIPRTMPADNTISQIPRDHRRRGRASAPRHTRQRQAGDPREWHRRDAPDPEPPGAPRARLVRGVRFRSTLKWGRLHPPAHLDRHPRRRPTLSTAATTANAAHRFPPATANIIALPPQYGASAARCCAS